jgi:HEAT repeat protein
MENSQQILDLLNSDDASIRKNTIESLLFSTPNEEVLEKLCDMITDSDKGVRNTLAIKLGSNVEWNAAKYLVKYISSEDISVRNLAGEILLKIGPGAVRVMEEKITTANDADQKFILDLLGLIGDPSIGETALKVLNESQCDNVILACIEALGNIRYPNAVQSLITLFNKSELYQPSVIEALGKIGGSVALGFMMAQYDVVDELSKYSIIEGLAAAGEESTFFFLLNKLYNTGGPLVWALINSIAQLKSKYGFDIPYDEKIRNLILRTISEGEPQFRNAAVQLAVNFRDADTSEQLLKIYGSDFMLDEDIKQNLFSNPQNVLTKIPAIIKQQPENLKELLFLLNEIIDMYYEDIKSIPLHNLNDALTQCITNPAEEVRRTAIDLLFKLDEEVALLFIDIMLEDENIWNRLRLVELIQNSKSPIAEDALQKLQSDEEQMVSDAAKQILSERQSEIQK